MGVFLRHKIQTSRFTRIRLIDKDSEQKNLALNMAPNEPRNAEMDRMASLHQSLPPSTKLAQQTASFVVWTFVTAKCYWVMQDINQYEPSKPLSPSTCHLVKYFRTRDCRHNMRTPKELILTRKNGPSSSYVLRNTTKSKAEARTPLRFTSLPIDNDMTLQFSRATTLPPI